MRLTCLLAFTLLWSTTSCERSLDGLPCRAGALGKASDPTECLSGYTCCDGLCDSTPSAACLATAGGVSGVAGSGAGGSYFEGGRPAAGRGGAPDGAGSGIAGMLAGGTAGSLEGGTAGSLGGGVAGTSGMGHGGTGGLGSPAACRDCELVRMTHDAPTVPFGGPGGVLYADVCPSDQALMGVQISVSAYNTVSAIAALCGHIRIERPAPGAEEAAALTVHEGAVLPRRGTVEGTHVVSRCSANEVVSAFDILYDHDTSNNAYSMRRLRLFCSPLSVRADGQSLSVEVGEAKGLPPLLDWPEQPDVAGPVPCVTGSVGRGLIVRAGLWVDGFSVACAVPELARRDGAPCTRDVECASGRCPACGDGCARTCQPFTCEGPSGCMCSVWDSRHYLFCSNGLAHDAAKSSCSDVGGHLMHVGTRIENGWARATASGWASMAGDFWLGADDREVEGVFRWSDRALVDAELGFLPKGSLPGEERDCLQLNTDGQWLSSSCDERRPYVCEIEAPEASW